MRPDPSRCRTSTRGGAAGDALLRSLLQVARDEKLSRADALAENPELEIECDVVFEGGFSVGDAGSIRKNTGRVVAR